MRLLLVFFLNVQSMHKACQKAICAKCNSVLISQAPKKLYKLCKSLHERKGCCDPFRAGGSGLFLSRTSCTEVNMELKDEDYEDLSLVEESELSNTEIKQYIVEQPDDGSCRTVINKTNLISLLSGVGVIIVMVGALAYYAHIKSRLLHHQTSVTMRNRSDSNRSSGTQSTSNGLLSAFLTSFILFSTRSKKSSRQLSTKRIDQKDVEETEMIEKETN